MGYKAPSVKQVVQKTPDPLINLGETSAAVGNEKRKRGMLSTFTGSGMSRSSGFLSGLMQRMSPSLGNANV